MIELVEYIAKSLVDSPGDVAVREEEGEDGMHVLLLSVAEDDMGKVIGKHGRIAKAIRTVVKAASMHQKERYTVEIEESSDTADAQQADA